MNARQTRLRVESACEDALSELRAKRWKGVDKILREAADSAAAMSAPRVRVAALPKGAVESAGEPRYSQSLERTLRILSLFTPERPVWGIADVADELGYSRSTTHRYIISLQRMGQVEATPQRKYRHVLDEVPWAEQGKTIRLPDGERLSVEIDGRTFFVQATSADGEPAVRLAAMESDLVGAEPGLYVLRETASAAA